MAIDYNKFLPSNNPVAKKAGGIDFSKFLSAEAKTKINTPPINQPTVEGQTSKLLTGTPWDIAKTNKENRGDQAKQLLSEIPMDTTKGNIVVPPKETTISQYKEPSFWRKAKEAIQHPFTSQYSPLAKDIKTQQDDAWNVYATTKLINNKLKEENIDKQVKIEDVAKNVNLYKDTYGIPRAETKGETYTKLATIPIAGALITNPAAIAIGAAGFEALSSIRTKALKKITGNPDIEKLSDLIPESASENVKTVVDVLEFLGMGLALHGIYKSSPKIAEKFTRDIVTKHNLPKTLYIKSNTVRDIFQTGTKATPEEMKAWSEFAGKLPKGELSKIVKAKSGVYIEIPAETITTMVDKPWFANVKKYLEIAPSEKVISQKTFGETKQGIAGLLKEGDKTIPSIDYTKFVEKPTEPKVGEFDTITEKTDIKDLNRPLNEKLTKETVDQTMSGQRESFRIDTPEKADRLKDVLGNKKPEDTILINRASTEPIKAGDHVTTIIANAERIAKNRDGATNQQLEVPVSDLVQSRGLRSEFIYAPKESVKGLLKEPTYKSIIGTSGLSKSIKSKAIRDKLIYGFDRDFRDLPTYDKRIKMEDKIKATDFVLNDYEKAFKIAMGREKPPADILPEDILVAVSKYASEIKDVETLRKLANESGLTGEGTLMGQRIQALSQLNPDAPLARLQEVKKARELKAEKTSRQNKKEVVDEINKEVETEVAKKLRKENISWDKFIDSITC